MWGLFISVSQPGYYSKGPILAKKNQNPCYQTDFDIIRQNFYTASNLKDLFHNIHPKRIISFVHAIGLTNKL